MSDKIDKVKPKWLEKAGEWYVKSKVVRGLMQVTGAVTLGGTSALDTALAVKIEAMRASRLRTFFEELDKGEIELTDELIETKDFLHAFFATAKAALNTRHIEKIKMFANLLNSFGEGEFVADEYEDYLRMLDELSVREIKLLCLLAAYEQKDDHGHELIKSTDTHKFWQDFIETAEGQLELEKDEIECMLASLTRTGCFRVFGISYADQLEFSGRLTRSFYKLKEFVKDFHIENLGDKKNV